MRFGGANSAGLVDYSEKDRSYCCATSIIGRDGSCSEAMSCAGDDLLAAIVQVSHLQATQRFEVLLFLGNKNCR